MSNSTTNLDLISSGQEEKEVTANELFDALSPSSLFGRRATTTELLTWGYYGGRMLVDGVLTTIVNSTVALSASTTNYVEATRAGVVSKNTTGFTAGSIPLYTIVTGSSTVSSYTDERAWIDPAYMMHKASVSITSADVTMSAEQARCRIISLSGTLTGNRNLITPNNGEWIVINGTSGAFTVTVKTSAGTGQTVDQTESKLLVADGTNVVSATSDIALNNTFGTIAVSGQSDVVADSSADTLTLAAGSGITLTTNAGTDTITITNSGTSSNAFETIAVSGQSNVVADSAIDTLTLVAGTGVTITTDAATDSITFNATGAAEAFKTIAVSGQSDVVADAAADTLTLAAGSGITLTTDAATDTITITNSGSASNAFETIAVSGQSNVVADSAIDTLTLIAGTGITITTNAGTDSITFNATATGPTLGTPQNSTSGTSIDFTGIPAGTKRIVVMFDAVSTNGSDVIMIQLGDAGGFENTGYVCSASGFATGVGTSSFTTGFGITNSSASGNAFSGHMTLNLQNSSTNTWTANGMFSYPAIPANGVNGGRKALSAELTQIRITTVSGTDAFDAGAINIQYE